MERGRGNSPPLNGQSVAENRNFVAKNSVFCPKNIVFGRILGGFFLNGKGGGYSTLPLTDGPLPKKLTERGGTPLPPSRQFPGLGLLNPSLSVLSTLITSQVPRPTSRERTPWALRAGNFTSEASSTENVDWTPPHMLYIIGFCGTWTRWQNRGQNGDFWWIEFQLIDYIVCGL